MRKLVSAFAITAGLTLLAVPAYAQDYPTDTDTGLTLSASTVEPGDKITIAGEGAEPGATVSFRLTRSSSALGSSRAVAAGPTLAALIRPQAQSSISLGSATADDDGSFSATLTIPSTLDAGVYTLTAVSGGEVLASATLRVLAGATGDLPFTGSNVAPGLAIGASLIVAGGLLLMAVRRRRSSIA
jgi:LPXTG-motif cell wall-anchored protein